MIESGIVEQDGKLSGIEEAQEDEYSDGIVPTLFVSTVVGLATFFSMKAREE